MDLDITGLKWVREKKLCKQYQTNSYMPCFPRNLNYTESLALSDFTSFKYEISWYSSKSVFFYSLAHHIIPHITLVAMNIHQTIISRYLEVKKKKLNTRKIYFLVFSDNHNQKGVYLKCYLVQQKDLNNFLAYIFDFCSLFEKRICEEIMLLYIWNLHKKELCLNLPKKTPLFLILQVKYTGLL